MDACWTQVQKNESCRGSAAVVTVHSFFCFTLRTELVSASSIPSYKRTHTTSTT